MNTRRMYRISVASIIISSGALAAAPNASGTPATHDGLGRDGQFYEIVPLGFSFQILSFFGCSFVFYRTLHRWRLQGYGSLAMAHRLPFYTALTDFFIAVPLLYNAGYTLVTGHPLTGRTCRVVAGVSIVLGTVNTMLFLLISVSTYLRVCRSERVVWGRYDHRLWLIISILVAAQTLPGIVSDGYGQKKYWCGEKAGSHVVGITAIAQFVTVVPLTSFCYLAVLRTLSLAQRSLQSQANFYQGDDIESHVAKKVASYMLVFILQWFPVILYALMNVLDRPAAWSLICGALGISVGGIGNAVTYAMNEGFSHGKVGTLDTRCELPATSESHPGWSGPGSQKDP